jgi:hypothetical protein
MLPGLSMLYDDLGITRTAGAPVSPVRTSESRLARACLADCHANVRGGGAGRIAFSRPTSLDPISITIPVDSRQHVAPTDIRVVSAPRRSGMPVDSYTLTLIGNFLLSCYSGVSALA